MLTIEENKFHKVANHSGIIENLPLWHYCGIKKIVPAMEDGEQIVMDSVSPMHSNNLYYRHYLRKSILFINLLINSEAEIPCDLGCEHY